MPKRGKDTRSSNRHPNSNFSPPRASRSSDYSMAPHRSISDSSTSGRISPHSITSTKQANGSSRHGNLNQRSMHTENSIMNDDDYKKLDSSLSAFRDNGSILKPDPEENTQIVKHFVPSIDRYHLSPNVPEKPIFRGPETDVLHDLEKDKLKSIRIQMIRADVQQTESYRKAYVVEDHVPRVKDENHQHFDDRQDHFNHSPVHYDRVENSYILSPRRRSHDRSLSPVMKNRPPSPPLPYSPSIDRFMESDIAHREPRSSRLENVHDRRASKKRHENFLEHPPPEPRSPSTSHYRSSDNRHRAKDDSMRYDSRARRNDSSPVYYEKRYQSYRSPSPTNRPFSADERPTRRIPLSPPRAISPSLKQHTSDDRPKRRRSPPQRYERSRERRRRNSPRRRTPPLRSPSKRRDNIDHRKKRSTSRNREVRRRENRRRSQSKSNSPPQEEEQSYSSGQPQSGYQPQPAVRIPPPRPYPGPMLIPLRPPLYPPPMGAWRPPRPPLQAPPPAGWPYPRPRPLYYPY